MHFRTRYAALLALTAGAVTIALGVPGPAAFASDGALAAGTLAAASGSDAARPQGSMLYAEAAYDAWRTGDGASVVDLAAPEVVQLLAAHPAGDGWDGDMGSCEGAAGSVYCVAMAPGTQLVLRVANQAASTGVAHAVTQATFARTPGAAAMWPLTTTEEAWNTQAQVDAGHSPWMLDPEAVVSAYAVAELGFTEPIVEPTATTFFTYRVVDAATGVAGDIGVNQPARQERGGIWTVTQAASLPASAPITPL